MAVHNRWQKDVNAIKKTLESFMEGKASTAYSSISASWQRHTYG